VTPMMNRYRLCAQFYMFNFSVTFRNDVETETETETETGLTQVVPLFRAPVLKYKNIVNFYDLLLFVLGVQCQL